MDILQITGLHKRFGDKEVIKGLTLSVPEHSIFGFIGQNGAGKTTTMKMILGLLKADSGKITVAGENVVYGRTSVNRRIGYLPDVPEFYPFMTAQEYLSFCGNIAQMNPAEIRTRSRELLELVGLGSEKHRIKGFSRGMKQRLGIAQALLHRPKLLICDEPTSALDPMGRKEILELLLAVREQTSILFSTHILSDVERICTDVAFLHNGTVHLNGALTEIMQKYRTEEYLLEPEKQTDLLTLRQKYPYMELMSGRQLRFSQKEHNIFDVLAFTAEKHVSLLKLERLEPSLETLFMEMIHERPQSICDDRTAEHEKHGNNAETE